MKLKNGEINDVDFWKRVEPLLMSGLADVNVVAPIGAVTQVLQLLLNRITKTVHVLLTLGRHHDGDLYQHDIRSLLRNCYDAYVQAAYIVLDKKTAEENAQDYLDFQHIERHVLMKKIAKSNVSFALEIMNSPLRAQNEALMLREFNRVAPRFETKSGDFRKNWYRGDLRSLAIKCDIAEEYDFLLSTLHPSVHSSAFALVIGGGVPHQHITFFAMRLPFRLLGLLGNYYSVTFSNLEVREVIDSFAKNLFTMPITAKKSKHA